MLLQVIHEFILFLTSYQEHFQTHAKKLLEITIPKILSEIFQWLARLVKDTLASTQVCVFSLCNSTSGNYR